MASSSSGGESAEDEIHLWREGDWWVIKDIKTGVTTQGRTREDALANLDEALAGLRGEGEPPTDEELRSIGIDPSKNTSGSLDDSEIFE